MIDRIGRLFRRSGNTPATDKKTPATQKPAADAAPPDPQRAAQIADAGRELDGELSTARALELARADLPAALRLRALGRVDARETLLELALHDKVAGVRLAAAEKLSAIEDLERLRRDSNDKAVQRHARDALKTLRDAEQAQAAMQQRIAQLLEAIAQHAARSWEPLYDARLDTLESSWREIAAQADAAAQERFAEQQALARDTVARHAAQALAREQAIAARQELIAACSELETAVQRLTGEDLSASLAAVAALRSTQQTRWDEAATLVVPVDAPLAARFRQAARLLDRWLTAAAELPHAARETANVLDALHAATADGTPPTLDELDDWQTQLDGARARIDWPAGLLPPALPAEIDRTLQDIARRRRALQADVREQVTQLRKRRNALRHMIDEGQLRVAVRTHHWLQKRIAELPAREAAQETTALQPLTEALARLHDWYEFASVPKKTELCMAMEALTVEAADIAARAAEVRALRERWNVLCAADPDADPELRARFDRAAGLAWAPCAAWYDAQHRLQDENQAQRVTLCEEIAALLPQTPADAAGWRAREKLERDARARWKTLQPVRWPEARAVQDRFHKLIDALRAQLAAERERGAAARRAVIARTRELLTQEPLDAALNSARGMQEEWQRCGWTDHRDDRALWQEFRNTLDAVFARREQARDAERQARAEQAAARERERAAETARREEQQAARRAARQAEIDAALAIAAAENDWLQGQAPAADVLLDGIAGRDAGKSRSALLPALRARVAALTAAAPDAATLRSNGERLATLTLELEILLDLPSPPELATARMQAKLEKLNAALRHRATAPGDDPRRTLEDAWLATGPVAADARAPLQARFLAALAARP